jgi:hypothetical protein
VILIADLSNYRATIDDDDKLDIQGDSVPLSRSEYILLPAHPFAQTRQKILFYLAPISQLHSERETQSEVKEVAKSKENASFYPLEIKGSGFCA